MKNQTIDDHAHRHQRVHQGGEVSYLDASMVGVSIGPCRVFDANGTELKHVISLCVETGEATTIAKDSDGKLVIDHSKCEFVKETRFYPAPLRLEPISK